VFVRRTQGTLTSETALGADEIASLVRAAIHAIGAKHHRSHQVLLAENASTATTARMHHAVAGSAALAVAHGTVGHI
jgi:hypothetical protein